MTKPRKTLARTKQIREKKEKERKRKRNLREAKRKKEKVAEENAKRWDAIDSVTKGSDIKGRWEKSSGAGKALGLKNDDDEWESLAVLEYAYAWGGLMYSLAACPAFNEAENAAQASVGLEGAMTGGQVAGEVISHIGAAMKIFKAIYDGSQVATKENLYISGDEELMSAMNAEGAFDTQIYMKGYFYQENLGITTSPKTLAYMHGRAAKNIGKVGLDTSASLSKLGTPVAGAVGGGVKATHEASSSASSVIHKRSLDHIEKSAENLSGVGDIKLFLKVLKELKISKATLRGATAVLDCVPIPGVSEIGGIVLNVGKTARRLSYTEAASNLCQMIHYLALREQYVYTRNDTLTSDLNVKGEPFNPYNYTFCIKRPASEIFRSIIWRNMPYAAYGYFESVQHDYRSIIKEDAGWMVMFDKAMSD